MAASSRHDFALHRQIASGKFGHALFDRRQIVERKRALVGEVVVEAVFDDRPDGHLRRREEFLDRVGQQVRRRMADHFEALGILLGDDGELGVVAIAEGGIDQTAIDLARQRRARQTGTDRLRHFGNRDRLRELLPGPVRQCDNRHGATSTRKWKSQSPALAWWIPAGTRTGWRRNAPAPQAFAGDSSTPQAARHTPHGRRSPTIPQMTQPRGRRHRQLDAPFSRGAAQTARRCRRCRTWRRRRGRRKNACRKFSLALLEGEDLLLDAAGDDQLVDEYRLVLAQAMRAIGGLVLHRRVPPGVVVDDGVGGGQIESDAAGFRLIRKIGTSPA
jgi:hypothetical protein